MHNNTNLLEEISILQCELQEKEQQIEALKSENNQLKTHQTHQDIDALTGLLTRTSLQAKFKKLTNNENTTSYWSLIYIDLDNFKYINDKFGHSCGDAFLREFGHLLKELIPTNDLAARLGGDEFCVIIEKPSASAYDLAELIRSQIAVNNWKAFEQTVTASLGIAEFKPEQSYEELFIEAGRCLYAAKQEGRNRVVIEANLDSTTEDEDLILADLENRIRVTTERLAQYMIIRSKRVINHYKQEASRDGLTGVYNRGYLDRLLEREIAKSRKLQRPLTVIMIDVDDFGKINTRFNWTAGDLSIQTVSSIIKKQIRVNDWVARYGGDEFIVVMPDTYKEEGTQAAERIRESLETTCIKAENGAEFTLTASIGVIESINIESPKAIYELVGTAARAAKQGGKNRVVEVKI